MDYIYLGKRIREERLKAHLTQEQLAEYSDISLSYMGQIERGERKVTLETLLRICNCLKVSVDFLLKDSYKADEDNTVTQFKQLISNKSFDEKQMAIDVLKTIFNHIDNSK